MNPFQTSRSFSDIGTTHAEINVVPLIDVMLVLLVVFLVTAPMLTHAVKINLPSARSTPSRISEKPIVVSLDEQGNIWIGQTPVTLEKLEAHFAAARMDATPGPSESTQALNLQVAATVPYEKVALVMSVLSRSGVTKVALLTKPEG